MNTRRTASALLATATLLAACSREGGDDAAAADSRLDVACDKPFVAPEGCMAAACEMAECGSPSSFLDENMCERKLCRSQDDCGPNEECRELQYLRPSCERFEADDECRCGSLLLNSYDWMCVPKSE